MAVGKKSATPFHHGDMVPPFNNTAKNYICGFLFIILRFCALTKAPASAAEARCRPGLNFSSLFLAYLCLALS